MDLEENERAEEDRGSDAVKLCVGVGGGGVLHRLRLGIGLGRSVDELGDLLVGEAGQAAERAGEVDRVVLVLAAEATEAEQLVDRTLEIERLLSAARDPCR